MRRVVLLLGICTMLAQAGVASARPSRHHPPLRSGSRPAAVQPAPAPSPAIAAATRRGNAGTARGGDAFISGADGDVRIALSGTMIGSVGSGRVEIYSSRPYPRVTVSGGACSSPSRFAVICSGATISFSVLGGSFRVIVSGTNLHASAVGHGTIAARGDGSTVVNGGSDVPWFARSFRATSF